MVTSREEFLFYTLNFSQHRFQCYCRCYRYGTISFTLHLQGGIRLHSTICGYRYFNYIRFESKMSFEFSSSCRVRSCFDRRWGDGYHFLIWGQTSKLFCSNLKVTKTGVHKATPGEQEGGRPRLGQPHQPTWGQNIWCTSIGQGEQSFFSLFRICHFGVLTAIFYVLWMFQREY